MGLLREKGRERRTTGDERAEEAFHRHGENAVAEKLRFAAVEKNEAGFGVVLTECLESGEVGGVEDGGQRTDGTRPQTGHFAVYARTPVCYNRR